MIAVTQPARRICHPAHRFRNEFLICAVLLLATFVHSQTGDAQATAPPAAATSSQQPRPEISSQESTTFKVRVNLVQVRVVVRDAKGNAIGNLKQQDFQLLDNGKPQVITQFSVEKGAEPATAAGIAPAPSAEAASGAPPTAHAVVPQRFIGYLFDDVHLNVADLAQARDAAIRQVQLLPASDRAAIYTTSGQTQLDFTDNREDLVATMNKILPRPIANTGVTPCPDISYFMADAILNRNDQQAMQVALQDAIDCGAIVVPTGLSPSSSVQTQLQAFARRELDAGDQEVRVLLGTLQNVVRRVAGMPGQRIVILASPGFILGDQTPQMLEIADRALRSGVVINTLDARGLYTTMPDASERSPNQHIAGLMLQYHIMEMSADGDVLGDLADATGGSFFHHNNDLDEGFRRLAGPPEYSYLLGFSPQSLKLDGHYHKLKVVLKAPAVGTIQARKGYYAPKGATDPSELAREAIEDAVFSQEEVRGIPVELHTQFFKPDQDDAKLSVVVHMDVRHVQFRKVDGRNDNDLTVVSALFDRNGNFITGTQKVLQLRLKDETLARLNSGITLKNNFDVKPGTYIVRLVVRDQDGQLAAQNGVVEIP